MDILKDEHNDTEIYLGYLLNQLRVGNNNVSKNIETLQNLANGELKLNNRAKNKLEIQRLCLDCIETMESQIAICKVLNPLLNDYNIMVTIDKE